ncbi:hypothetical protein HDU99_000237, partial [Rhizoclosmatium hyalinum]
MSHLVTGSPFLLSFQYAVSCFSLPDVPTLGHLCLSRSTSASHMTLSAPELADAYKSKNLITFKGSSSVCGSNTDVGDRLNTVLSETVTALGPVSSYEYDVYLSGATVSQFYLAYAFVDDFYPCGFFVYNAAAQDPKYILSAPPKCGSKFTKTPSSAINPEASCFGALQFDGKTGTASFPWCDSMGSYSEANLAQRYGATTDTMALYSLGTDKLVVQFANDWSASSDPETLCTLEYHSISLNETTGTFYLSSEYTIIGDVGTSYSFLVDTGLASIKYDAKTGKFTMNTGDGLYPSTSFNDRFNSVFSAGLFVTASFVDKDTVIVVISDTQIMNSNVGVQISLQKRRDGVKLGETDYMLVYKRGIAPTSTQITSKIVSSTVLSRPIFTSTVPISSTFLSSTLPTTGTSSIVLSSTVSSSTSHADQTTSLASLTTALPSATVPAPASSTGVSSFLS